VVPAILWPSTTQARHEEVEGMSDRPDGSGEGKVDPEPNSKVGAKAGRFSKEFVATVISLVTTALGVVVALAWNSALTALFTVVFGTAARIAAMFIYAICITTIGVVVIIALGKLATRIGAEPIEFKFPAKGGS
jgi:hypothetical protein